MPDQIEPTQPQSTRRRGRPKGSRNKVSKKAQAFFLRLWGDKDFRRKFKQDWVDGKLPPQMYVTGAQYAFGKPPDHVTVSADADQSGSPAFVLVVDGKALTPGTDGNNE